MTITDHDIINLYAEVCSGNTDAFLFVCLWAVYVHAIDDIIDGEKHMQSAESILEVFAQANILFTQPFYRQHAEELQMVVMKATNAYADSVALEKSADKGLRKMADVLRFAGNEMLFAVALICGGFQHMSQLSPRIREMSWAAHHDENGAPK